MYLLYIDGSGSVKNPNEEYFILGGVSVFERQIFHLIKRMDEFVESLDFGLLEDEDIELHASTIASGREKPWKGNVQKARRFQIIEDALEIVKSDHKERSAWNMRDVQPPFSYSASITELRGRNRPWKSNYESALQSARTFRVRHAVGRTPRGGSSESLTASFSNFADLVAWAVWRRYEFQDTRYFDKIVSRFDTEGGEFHGLVHFGPKDENCHCPACFSRARRDAASQ